MGKLRQEKQGQKQLEQFMAIWGTAKTYLLTQGRESEWFTSFFPNQRIHNLNLPVLGTALPGFRGCNPPWLRLSQSWDPNP